MLRIGGDTGLGDCLLAVDSALMDWPRIDLTPELSFYLLQGQPVQVPGAPARGLLRVYDEHARFIGLGTVLADGRVAPKRMLRSR